MRSSSFARNAAFLLGAAGCFWIACAALPADLYQPSQAYHDANVYESGETLLHRLPAGSVADNFHMPLASIGSALLYNRVPADAARAFRFFPTAAAFALMLAIGRLLGSRTIGLAAVALMLVSTRLSDGAAYLVNPANRAEFIEPVMALLALVVAGHMIGRRGLAPRRRSALLAAALGVTLLYRSTFALLPPLLSWRARRRGAAAALLLALAPYLFLLPWIGMNWKVHRVFLPFERAEANLNVVGGALGALKRSELEKDQAGLERQIGLDLTDNGQALRWAARRVMHHPVFYLRSCWARVRYALGLQPLLAVLFIAGAWAGRRREEVRELAFLSGYYLLVHCLMAVDEVYFLPLWPLFALTAAGGLLGARKWGEADGRTRRADRLLAFCLAAMILSYAWAASVLSAYARGPRASDWKEGLDQAIGGDPEDVWLRVERAKKNLQAGATDAALEDLRAALARQPERAEAKMFLASARLAQGHDEEFRAWVSAHPESIDLTDSLLRVRGFFKSGLPAEGEAEMRRGLSERYPGGACAACGPVISGTRRWFGACPAPERLEVIGAALKAAPQCGCFWFEQGELARQAGREVLARRSSARAERLLSNDERRGLALLYQGVGRFDLSLAILDRLSASEPANARYLLDRAIARRLSGHAGAVADLQKAISLAPGMLGAYATLGAIYIEQGRLEEAVKLYDQALRAPPEAGQENLRAVITRDRDDLSRRLKR